VTSFSDEGCMTDLASSNTRGVFCASFAFRLLPCNKECLPCKKGLLGDRLLCVLQGWGEPPTGQTATTVTGARISAEAEAGEAPVGVAERARIDERRRLARDAVGGQVIGNP
jgi:hypothetical protein